MSRSRTAFALAAGATGTLVVLSASPALADSHTAAIDRIETIVSPIIPSAINTSGESKTMRERTERSFFLSRNGSATRNAPIKSGRPTAPTGSSEPWKYLSSSNNVRKYHSGRAG